MDDFEQGVSLADFVKPWDDHTDNSVVAKDYSAAARTNVITAEHYPQWSNQPGLPPFLRYYAADHFKCPYAMTDEDKITIRASTQVAGDQIKEQNDACSATNDACSATNDD